MDIVERNDSYFTDSRWQGNANRLKHLSTGSGTCGAKSKTPTVFLHDNLLQSLEVPLDVRLFERMSCGIQAPIQFLSQNKRQETTENMATDGFIPLMKDWPGVQYRLHDIARLWRGPPRSPLSPGAFCRPECRGYCSPSSFQSRSKIRAGPILTAWAVTSTLPERTSKVFSENLASERIRVSTFPLAWS